MNVRGIQRNVKNVVKNYSQAQVMVREATSNDPWGPAATLMSEIADMTYNVVAFSEIMQMIWKRLNDHGKNWRHVYKALVLLEYLIKTGSEKVAQQCKENIFAIQTLKDFQYIEENKDQGLNVREKSKALVALLKDDEKLRAERTRALKAKERFAQAMSYTSDGHTSETIPKTSLSYHESLGSSSDRPLPTELEAARPQTAGEEELQLQLALAMSKEEAEQEEKLRKNDDLRLQLAISESQKQRAAQEAKRSAVDDLLSLNTSLGATGGSVSDPWGSPLNGVHGAVGGAVGGTSALAAIADPWAPPSKIPDPTPLNDPWAPSPARSSSATNDPWQPSPPPQQSQSLNQTPIPNSNASQDPWASIDTNGGDKTARSNSTGPSISRSPETTSNQIRKTPESFLGPNSNLVNLDALVSSKTPSSVGTAGNPFAGGSGLGGISANPFQAAKPAAPTINQLRSQGAFPLGNSAPSGSSVGAFAGGPILMPTSTFGGQPTSTSGSTFGGPAETNRLSTNSFNSIPSGNNPFSM